MIFAFVARNNTLHHSDINRNIPTTRRWARGDRRTKDPDTKHSDDNASK